MKKKQCASRNLKVKILSHSCEGLAGVNYFLTKEGAEGFFLEKTSNEKGEICFCCLPEGRYRLTEGRLPPQLLARHLEFRVCVTKEKVFVERKYCCLKICYEEQDNNYGAENSASGTANVILDLLKVVTNLIPGVGGSGVLGLSFIQRFFVEEPDYRALLEAIGNLIGEKIEFNQIKVYNGQINGILRYINDYYKVQKQDYINAGRIDEPEVKEKLYNLLLPKYGELWIAYESLKLYAKQGFPVFLLATAQLILVTQEMALVDEALHYSSYLNQIKNLAKEAADFAKGIADELEAKRRGELRLDYNGEHFGGKSFTVWDTGAKKEFWSYGCGTSSVVKTYIKDCKNFEAFVKNDFPNLVNKEIARLFGEWAYETWAADMKKLQTTPMPGKA